MENDVNINGRDTDIVRQAQRKAREANDKDESILCEPANTIDKLLRPVLEEVLPLLNEHYIMYYELREWGVAFHDGIYKEYIAERTFSDV